MDYKNDNRTPRDRVTGEFLSELLFTDLGGDCDCENRPTAPTSATPTSTAVNRSKVSYCSKCTRESRQQPRYGCTYQNKGVEITGAYSLAMAYVPMQNFGDLFDVEEGFCQGTIFKDLKFPFCPTPCRKEAD